jgi:hypothetical protein
LKKGGNMVDARYQFAGRCVTGTNPSEPNPQISPNFSLRELARADKTYFIHPNLILTLQNIRNLVGQGITVVRVDEDGQGTRGFCATIRAANTAALRQICLDFAQAGIISKQSEGQGEFFFEGRTSPLDRMSLEDAMEVAFYVTTGFETSGDPFQQVTGNFDKAGISFGPSQVNFSTGTLIQLFRRLEHVSSEKLQQCFGAGSDWLEWRELWEKPVARQLAWANDHSTGPKKASVMEPWRTHLKRVGQIPAFRREMMAYSKEVYGEKLRAAFRWLQAQSHHSITDLRCFCALFDLCTQQGSLDKSHDQIVARIFKDKPTNQKELVQIACEERAKTAAVEWRATCVSRRLGILYNAPMAATESDKTAKADNPYFSLLPEIEVQGIDQFVES